MALPWLCTHSAHQPFPHSEQIPCEGVFAWLAQRRHALPPPWDDRGTAVRAGLAGGATDAGREAGGASGPGADASASDASATTKTVLQPLQRAFRFGTPSLSGGTRRGRRHSGHRTVTVGPGL